MKMTGSKLLSGKYSWTFVDYVDWRGSSNYKKNKKFGKSLRKSLKNETKKEIENTIY